MNDQAEHLRDRLRNLKNSEQTRTIAVASGKGGVGKSNFTINFALKLIEKGKRVLIFDMDIGMGNIDILLGVSPKFTFVDLFSENRSIHDIIETGPNSLSYIAGGSGLSSIFRLDENKFRYFQFQFESLFPSYDIILFDMGAGATSDSLHLISAADEAIVVTTPEPTSITDAYAMIKHLVKNDDNLPISILVNRSVREQRDSTFTRLHAAVEQFLHVQIKALGVIPDDRNVLKAVTKQIPFVLSHPGSQSSKAVERIVDNYLQTDKNSAEQGSSFLTKLKKFVLKGNEK